MIDITISKGADFRQLEALWRELEARTTASFFQSWNWTACLARERFPNPVLLIAREGGQVVALGLFNASSSGSTLSLGENGEKRFDDIFIEHNGFLVEQGRADLIALLLEAARTEGQSLRWQRNRLVRLSGVSEEYVATARENRIPYRVFAVHEAPFVDFDYLRQTGRDPLSIASRNTRYQVRRSEREYGALGRLSVERANSAEEAQDFLTALSQLHQAYWARRGHPGAFANPNFFRFHRALINRAFAGSEIDLLRIVAGTTVIGYLYNFLFKQRVFAYQSGFNYQLFTAHQKPGLTCHHLAMQMYLAKGARTYDFLAGADRYKLSFASSTEKLYWLEYGIQGIGPNIGRGLCSLKHRFVSRIGALWTTSHR